MKIKVAITREDILKCFDAIHSLRPKMTKENIVERITGMMSEGYILIYVEDNGKAPCFCGYRYANLLAWGKAIYIDDLGTVADGRGKGYASALLDYVFEEARKNNCEQIHLDSGCFPERYDAHRLYLNKGFNILAHHFAYKLK